MAWANVSAHGTHAHDEDASCPAKLDSAQHISVPKAATTMGMDEKPGALVPLGLKFVAEHGDTILLKDAVTGPTVLCLLYFGCTNACGTMIAGIASVLRTLDNDTASAPNIVTISIDERENAADAMKEKKIAFEMIQRPYPEGKWHFLTGPAPSISALAGAVGFHYVKKDDDYDHPLGLIILSPQGKVVRYILGSDFLPMDLTMSLMEAKVGTVQPTIARVLRFCFSVDPASHRFVFNILRVSSVVIFSIVGSFIVFLIVIGRRRTTGRRR
jgi:protein SCO1/2